MKELVSISDTTITPGTKVLVRSDLDVPMKNGKIKDNFRLVESGRTISYLQEQGAKIVVIGHLGRNGETLRGVSLALPIGHTFLGTLDINYLNSMREGEVVMLENLRKDTREVLADPSLAEQLVNSFDIYVFDAFSVSHRKHTSVIHIPKILKTYGGIRFTEEINEIKIAREIKERLFILGGGKAESKLQFLKKMLTEKSKVITGGVVLNTILKVEGYEVGNSIVGDDSLSDTIKGVFSHPSFIKPIDLVVEKVGGEKRISRFDELDSGETIMDLGPKTISRINEVIGESVEKVTIWNGPLGWIEKGYNNATKQVGEKIISNDSIKTILGGGDTHMALFEILPTDSNHFFVSTGGGAMLKFFLDGTIPIFESINK